MKRPLQPTWHSEVPGVLRNGPLGMGMLRPNEATALLHLARDHYEGRGRIIDAGAYLGSSAWAFGQGLRERGSEIEKSSRSPIVSYDLFRDYGQCSGSFLAQFVANVAPVIDLIEIRQGDFVCARWDGDPIEILFNDISKTRELWAHMLVEFVPHCIPDGSVLIQQDYHHPYLYYLHVTMEMLSQYFEVLDEKVDDSCIYWLRSRIPVSVLHDVANRVERDDFQYAEVLGHLASARERIRVNHHLDLVEVMVTRRHRGNEEARRLLARIVERRGEMPEDPHWALYVAGVKRLLE